MTRTKAGRTVYVPAHLSKDQDIPIGAGDLIEVSTPGGGGFGEPFRREPERVAQDVASGYYTRDQAASLFGVGLESGGGVDAGRTKGLARRELKPRRGTFRRQVRSLSS